jgi:dTDP-4-dehydrorhamnose reductase
VLLDVVEKAQNPDAGSVKVDDWAQRYPTNTEDVARVCRDIAVKYLTDDKPAELPTILQFSSEDCMTKYAMCEILADIMAVPVPGLVRNRDGNDLKEGVQRPFNTHLSNKVLKELGIDVQTQSFQAWW